MKKLCRRIVDFFFGEYLTELKRIRRSNYSIMLHIARIDQRLYEQDQAAGMKQPLGPIEGIKVFGDQL